ncbi:MAG: DNA-protecting protein DprA [Candidatus Blackburnbacteria bacterium]|nr:DNA-protecting protein DprA [Candidatus Blackburnbacteria bacterium]
MVRSGQAHSDSFDERNAWIAFSCFPQIGPARFKLLLKYFGNAQKAWGATTQEYIKLSLKNTFIADFGRFREGFNLSSYLLRMEKLGVKVITLEDSDYPELLKKIDDSPYILYVKDGGQNAPALDGTGQTKHRTERIGQFLNSPAVAVVGTRKMTAYGREVTERLVTGLVDSGVTIVSGLALGIDAVAHKTALDAGGYTIGVLGGGLDNIYPPSNKRLAQEMNASGRGIIVSEYPLGYPYLPQNFPTRNRIIAGMAYGVLVIEGAEKSGTLLTASAAARYGREVFSVPGPVTSLMSRAPHFLIKNGAKLVEKVEDILEELDVETKHKTQRVKRELPETEEEKKLFNILKSEPIDIDSLVRMSGLATGVVLSALTIMELKGMLKNIGGVYTVID